MSEETAPENATEETAPEVNEYQSKYERLAALERYVDALGSTDKLIELATVGHRVNTDPTLRTAIEQALNPKKEEAPEPELYDPEVKTVYQEFDPKIRALQEELSQARAQVSELATERYRETVATRMETVLKGFEHDPALLKEAKETLDKALGSASPQQLEQLHQPGGEKTLKMMLVDQYEKMATAPKKNVEPPVALESLKATDARHVTRAALPANTVGVKSGVKITSQTTREILEQVTAKLGKDPKSFWN
jgi:hypothetical protein